LPFFVVAVELLTEATAATVELPFALVLFAFFVAALVVAASAVAVPLSKIS
jgi:hypothetical protein